MNMTEDDIIKPKSNLSSSVAAMSQRLKAARQQQQQPSSTATAARDSLVLLGRSPSPTPVLIREVQADLESNIQELEVTSMTDRIRESEGRLSDVTAENVEMRSIIEELEGKLMAVMESKEDDVKNRQLQWEEESDKIVKEFEMENQELRREMDKMADELDATKSALLMLQEDYRTMDEGVGKLREELEGERQLHVDTKGELIQLTAEMKQLEREKGDIAKEVEADNADNRLQDELKDSVKEKDVIINNLRNELEITRGLHEQELSVLRKTLDNARASETKVIATPSQFQQQSSIIINNNSPRPIIFLDIDGVLNFTKHNKQIHFEATHLKLLKTIIEKTNALVVLSTFWRHFHEYITYVFHRHGIDVASCMLPLPMGATKGKQTTKKFLHYHRLKQGEINSSEEESMIGRSADDDAEYSSRSEEIEAWLKMYGAQYLGGGGETSEGREDTATGYDWHNEEWKYIILDDRPSAAKPDTPLFDRFVNTETEVGITEEEADWATELLLYGSQNAQSRRRNPSNVKSLDEIFSYEQCNISPDLAVLLTPERSPKSTTSSPRQQHQQQEQLKQEPRNTTTGNDADESLKSSHYDQQYESEILAAMCDYSNVCPTLVALMQPQAMDDNDDYQPLSTMMKSFEDEKKTSFDEIEDQAKGDVIKETDYNSQLEPAGSFDSLVDNQHNLIPAPSPPPMNMFHKFAPPMFAENTANNDENSEDNNDIGLDDLGPRWKTSSLSAAIGAPPLTSNDDLDDE
ncbi:hypothetical protein QTG54_009050 [Skeletonema marinoi]|uniref:Uncharacterized protein n=1 Tax=Skeletonema marinoi TaxID=267567 RepID=A0AAD9DBZ0_9STRA|nr:hypothetical protein QTG54_009050 [Skeletonema marinoi]